MREKSEIVANWLPRYTGTALDAFGEYILLTNFGGYVSDFCRLTGARLQGNERPMPNATHDGITMINFGMGSANAATVMDLLSAIRPRGVLFLGKCGGLKQKSRLGDLVLPIAGIRGEGTSGDYLPQDVPALPSLAMQRAVAKQILRRGLDYGTGTVYTTNRRVWEHDEEFKTSLRRRRCMAIDMETSTLFAAGFANQIPCGALLLVSDRPMVPDGVKTEASDKQVTAHFVQSHIELGIESLKAIRAEGISLKHLRFDEAAPHRITGTFRAAPRAEARPASGAAESSTGTAAPHPRRPYPIRVITQSGQRDSPSAGRHFGTLPRRLQKMALLAALVVPFCSLAYVWHQKLQPAPPAPVVAPAPPVIVLEPELPLVAAVEPPPAPKPEKPIVRREKPAPPQDRPATEDSSYRLLEPPRYPSTALRRGEEGSVMLRVLVNADGSPSTIDVATSSRSRSLDRAARDAVKKWKFNPGRKQGIPISSWVLVPIDFKLCGAAGGACEPGGGRDRRMMAKRR